MFKGIVKTRGAVKVTPKDPRIGANILVERGDDRPPLVPGGQDDCGSSSVKLSVLSDIGLDVAHLRANDLDRIDARGELNVPSPPSGAVPPPKAAVRERYIALDAYRGFIMLILAAEGFGFYPLINHPTYGRIARWFVHSTWVVASTRNLLPPFEDLIMPAFLFMVGAALPFALAQRERVKATEQHVFRHVVVRVIKLLLLSQILVIASQPAAAIKFKTVGTLFAIAFSYFFTFLILKLKFRWQVATALLILIAQWALFVSFPGPQGAFCPIGNIGEVIDKAVLGYNYPETGHTVTINCVGCLLNTLFGAWTSLLLLSTRDRSQKIKILCVAMVSAFVAGLALSPVVPIIKNLWTASYTLYSTGWVLLMLLAFIVLVDIWGFRKPVFPLIVVGMNSIFIYSCTFLMIPAINGWLMGFTGGFKFIGTLAPVAQDCAVTLVLWYLCYWLYQRKIVIKL